MCTPGKLKTQKGDLGKKGFPVDRKPERAVQEKVRDKIKKKFVHPASRKPEREAWEKKGIPVD